MGARVGSLLTTATVRAIQALGTGPAGRADQIADRLAEAIRLGLIAPGERLPAEAALSEQLGVATLTLREALATLRDRGLVFTRRGRSGGSFVAEAPLPVLARAPHSPPSALVAFSLRRLSELGDLRRATFATAAALAAERATAPEIDALRRRAERLAVARTPGERRRADGEFAIELAAAAQSPRLTQDEANLRAELGDLVWTLLCDAEHDDVVAARRALVDAVADGDAAAAVRLAERQIAQETELLLRHRLELYRTEAAATGYALARDFTLTRDVERIFEALTSTAEAFAATYAATEGSRPCTLADLAALRPRLHATLDAFDGLAVGTGIVVAPGLLSDASYWLEWWWRRQPGAAPEALRVNLDPQSPDFFDYVNNEWFDIPVTSGRRHVAGPYVDYACTNQYTFTFSVPVFHKGKPLGVTAMDVPCDQVERRLLPALCADPTPRTLRNPHGRLIASAQIPPAAPRPPSRLPRPLLRLCALTGWTITE
jgi:DNA-binding FadR family transcriptional regulator